ncbi:MAG: TlpA family protein disulfide reductase [Verrucomicrobia bacterium]|nr:MAG: TlpA family protein disulfide reductase [Verrucomicrobiota bacterium]
MKTVIFTTILVLVLGLNAHALTINNTAPLFSLRDNSGDFFYLSSYLKKSSTKGIIINFFSSTCKPCKHELPILNSLVPELSKKGIAVVIIGYKEAFDKFMDMLEKLKVDKPLILSDVYGKVGEKYGVYGLPLTIFVGADSKVKDIIKGELPNIEKVLREKSNRLFR